MPPRDAEPKPASQEFRLDLPPWELTEQEIAELTAMTAQMTYEREEVYGNLAEDVQAELDNRRADAARAAAEAVSLERAQPAVEVGAGEPQQLDRDEPQHDDRDYDAHEYDFIEGREPFESVEEQARRLDQEIQNDRTQERYDAEDLADQMVEEAAHRAAEYPDNAAALVSIAAELRETRVYLEQSAEQRTERAAEHGEQAAAGPTTAQLAQEEQQHRESARVMTEREQPQQERGIER